MFVVPAFTEAQAKIPYSRVNHNKYMVTDQTAYIGKYCVSVMHMHYEKNSRLVWSEASQEIQTCI